VSMRAGCALMALAFGSAACAQTVAANDAQTAVVESARETEPVQDGILDIVVTARRTSERVQTVPITVTALSGDDVQKQDARSLFDLDRKIPGLQIVGRQGPVGNNAFLRGIPGVIGYWAETPVTLASPALLFDMGNLQALKGPQGTLFGLSANAGAIIYEPKRPEDEIGGYAQVTLGSYDRLSLEGAINLPIGDRVRLRASGIRQKIGGYTFDVAQNRHVNDENYWIGRFAADIDAADNLTQRFTVNVANSNSRGDSLFVLYAVNPDGAARDIFGPQLDQLLATQKEYGFYKVIGSDKRTFSKSRQINFSSITEWNISSGFNLKNIFGYQSIRSYGYNNIDGVPLPIIDTFDGPSRPSGPSRQYSEEVQAQGRLLGDRLSYTAGAFLLWSRDVDPQPSFSNVFGGLNGSISEGEGRTKALYAQVNYDLSDLLPGLEVTGGYRHTWDYRKSAQTYVDEQYTPLAALAADAHFEADSYTFQARYRPTERLMFYFNNAKGYSSGGFNLNAPPQFKVYQPESLTNYEAGFKSDWRIGDASLRVNAAYFYGKYDDIQVQVTQPVETPTGTVLAVVRQNAAKGKIEGQEVEIEFLPTANLQLSFNGTHLSGKYTRFMSNGEDLSGTPFLYMPKYKYSIGATYTLPLDERAGTMAFATDYTRQTSIKTNIGAELLHPFSTTPPIETMNARLDWNEVLGSSFDLSVFVTNITKNKWAQGQLGAYNSLGIWGYAAAIPRMFGVRGRYSF
jgi:iron complex outermembrane receptor protein